MKELKKYVCDFCKTEYSDKSKAEQCENNHKRISKVFDCRYLPITLDATGFPIEITVKMPNGEAVKYHRKKG